MVSFIWLHSVLFFHLHIYLLIFFSTPDKQQLKSLFTDEEEDGRLIDWLLKKSRDFLQTVGSSV